MQALHPYGRVTRIGYRRRYHADCSGAGSRQLYNIQPGVCRKSIACHEWRDVHSRAIGCEDLQAIAAGGVNSGGPP